MTTIAIPQTTNRGASPLPILLLAVLALIVAGITYQVHAVERHGVEAQIVRECIGKNGAIEKWMNFDNGRQALICEIRDGLWGVQIRKNGREITSFLKNKLSRIEQVYQYLLNQGYRAIR
jgi:hypothetical protein